jgi:hypothetical protein
VNRRRRVRQPPPDLTSLFDVLFIVIFAALIRAAASAQAAAHPLPKPPAPPPVPLDPASLHARALASIDRDFAARPTVIVRVSTAGTVTAIETDGKVEPLDVPLLEHSADPNVAVAYLGERSVELRACRIAAVHLLAGSAAAGSGANDLATYLVIIAPAQRLEDLPHALFDGLHRDLDRCMTEQHTLAVIIEPAEPKP